ncbi:hypothetical protein Nepgr_014661 [Nepenthes gracilis]|uniref:Uncharacterized protein n=1 Tax=Nepenthes gracilis TaxID=150966 RepID=A0AAD3SL92_NEPGR|nr:hypothetical protein Nepgr_014661 [Nepenthes gracilis]
MLPYESRRDFGPALSCVDPDDGVVGSDSVSRAFAAAFHLDHSARWWAGMADLPGGVLLCRYFCVGGGGLVMMQWLLSYAEYGLAAMMFSFPWCIFCLLVIQQMVSLGFWSLDADFL